MNVISTYLDTMFSPYPQTPRLLAAKTELQEMMEDAYASHSAKGLSHNEAIGRVITDFGNLDELAPVLGISGELGDIADTASAAQHPPVTLDEAQGFAEAHRRTRFRLSTSVALFVIAPIALIVLPVAAQSGLIPLDQSTAGIVGLLVLFAIVAIGIVTLIGLSREFAPYSRIREERFSRNPVVTSWAEELAQQHDPRRIRALQLAVTLWILSPAPLLLLTLVPQDSQLQDFWAVTGVALLLLIVAAGLAILLPTTWAHTTAETLARGGKHPSGTEDSERSVVGVIAAFYWPLLTAVFLAWSFIGNAWDRSWIVWPVGAVLFGALAAGGGAIESYRRGRR